MNDEQITALAREYAEEIKYAAKDAVKKEYNCKLCQWRNDCDFCGGQNSAYDCCECPADSFEEGFIVGANLFLGKQEKDVDTVIIGWVCRDNNSLNAQVLIGDKPKRTGFNYWENKSADCITLPKDLFPDLAWDDDPQEVEIILKRKKK